MDARHSTPTPKPWSDDETDRLADVIADGGTFGRAAQVIGRTRNSCVSRWNTAIVKPLGAQAA